MTVAELDAVLSALSDASNALYLATDDGTPEADALDVIDELIDQALDLALELRARAPCDGPDDGDAWSGGFAENH